MLQHGGQVDFFGDSLRNVLIGEAFLLVLIKEPLVFDVDKMTNALKNGHRVGFLLGVLPESDQLVKQLVGVGHIEVARNDEVACAPVVLAQKRMAILNLVFAVSAVPQVGQKQFPGKRHFLLQKLAVFQLLRGEPFKTGHDAAEDVLDGPRVHGTNPGNVPLARGDVQLDVGESGSVLATVVLLLHEQVHLIESIKCTAVFVDVVLQRLLQSKHCNAAFVLEKVAHAGRFWALVEGQIYSANRLLEQRGNIFQSSPPRAVSLQPARVDEKDASPAPIRVFAPCLFQAMQCFSRVDAVQRNARFTFP